LGAAGGQGSETDCRRYREEKVEGVYYASLVAGCEDL